MIYFTSDTHFWHRGILEHCEMTRPYTSVEEMNEGLINNWNSRVGINDTVFHLGDFCFAGSEKSFDVFSRLNGHNKYLVRGNHDGKAVIRLPWTEVFVYHEISPHVLYEGDDGNVCKVPQRIVLMHFPILSWNSMAHGSWHLHGHCHGTLPDNHSKRMDVGIDAEGHGFPLSIDEISWRMGQRKFIKIDHHGKKDEK